MWVWIEVTKILVKSGRIILCIKLTAVSPVDTQSNTHDALNFSGTSTHAVSQSVLLRPKTKF